jgi:hypothetical protein
MLSRPHLAAVWVLLDETAKELQCRSEEIVLASLLQMDRLNAEVLRVRQAGHAGAEPRIRPCRL